MVDIGDERQLRDYLRGRNIFADVDAARIIYYPGGVSGIVALASDGSLDVIIKQALPRLKVKEIWECDPGRIITEHRAHEVYARLAPDSVPEPLFADEENKVIGRIGAPDGTPMWKTQLLSGLLDFRVAEKAIGALLTIHNASARDDGVRRAFDDNSIFYDLRISPYIEKTVTVHPGLAERARPIINRLMTEKITLVHGDYSPKNILVTDSAVWILDYEVAHFGHPSFDLAFFFNHFMLKSVKNRQWRDAYLNMLLYMAGIYFSGVDCMAPALLEAQTTELLAFMLLARMDGKSPAEYIVRDEDKDLVRRVAFAILRDDTQTLRGATDILMDTSKNALLPGAFVVRPFS